MLKINRPMLQEMVMVKCKHCTASVSGTNMSRHLQKHHPEHYVARTDNKKTTVNLQCRHVSSKMEQPKNHEEEATRAHTSRSEIDQIKNTAKEPAASSTEIDSSVIDVSVSSQATSQSVGGDPLVSPIAHLSTAQHSTPTNFLHGRLTPEMAAIVTVAVQDLVESHHIYDAVNLGAAMAQNFPDLPTEVVPYIVVAATSAAQHVAHIHMMRELYMNAENTERRKVAENALASMMSWSFGLRRSTQLFAVPIVQPPNTLTSWRIRTHRLLQ